MGINVVVGFWEADLEFENAICEGTTSHEDDAVKVSQIIEGWYEVDASWGMLFQVLVFNCYLVISQSLFSFLLQQRMARVYCGWSARTRATVGEWRQRC